jgi:hypothetical protein
MEGFPCSTLATFAHDAERAPLPSLWLWLSLFLLECAEAIPFIDTFKISVGFFLHKHILRTPR